MVSHVSYDAGAVRILVDYSKDLEGANCSLTLTYDQDVAVLGYSIIHFDAVSRNEKLVYAEASSQEAAKNNIFFFKILAYAALGVFLLSLPLKMVGPELVVCLQLAYFSCIYY